MNLNKLKIDSTWTLFLDRDGVINTRLINDYVKALNELKIIAGVPEAISQFTKLFGRIVVVTNQQGIGKGIMTTEDLSIIHGFIADVVKQAGGHINQFYFAPQLKSENSEFRKPNPGMGYAAKNDYPEIDFEKSLMIGDTESDIEFGINLGMKTIMLTTERNVKTKADYIFENLHEVAKNLK
ncbi:D-glycero-alpha-D-manno-heptose-1,7-bisphosphate 7-phosphatase [Crocinitomix algicola]|uniref:D-glycero-alpha-D-manno-heptose-1,7-bisphosphate 7-phosphatase n=1 Tax=Crocinitomix algicola TaxID=1740263 RepID=UPI00083540F0|nr:HAD-IIIA family hydrolase [Crocinitomix algicola]